MYLGSFNIDEYVGIPVDCHRFSTGAAYAPTSLTYSIYEDSGTTGIDEDVDMTPASPFDGIVGHYWARRQLTAAAGFEAGKNYHVVVKATVDGVAAITSHVFQILAKVATITNADKTGYTAGPTAGSIVTASFGSCVPPAPSDMATATELAKVPKSDGSASWNATALAAINAEVDTAFNTAIPGSPAANSINERIKTLDDDWNDGGRLDLLLDGASAPSAATVADAVWDEALAGHSSAGTAGKQLSDMTPGTPVNITHETTVIARED